MDRGTVFVIGAGPAGLFATRKIAAAGFRVVIFNRDVKPGGLAEYGIYPEKHHMKQGLRKQFSKILEMPNVQYLGNVPVADGRELTCDGLREWNPQALVFAVGAQGTKKLGLPGEDAKGLYSAKDFVYHYNQLPPFASMDFSTGRRVAIVGMGNVMVDIARWLLLDMPGRKPEEVVVVARRGPFEVKFDEKEFDHIEMFLDRRAFKDELERIGERIRAAGQDVSQVPETVFSWLKKPGNGPAGPRLSFRFLTSPAAVRPDAQGRIAKLTVVENLLLQKGESTQAVGTDQTSDLEFDTLIYAIGDVVDPLLGLPFEKGTYVTNPDSNDSDRGAYEVFDAKNGKVLEGNFVVGWARKASEGLVGKARYDAEHGCDHVLKYLESAEAQISPSTQEILATVGPRAGRIVTKDDVRLLARAEEAQAKLAGLPAFKYSTNQEMFAAIERQRQAGGEIRPSASNNREAA